MNFNKNFFSTSNILNNKVFGIIIIALSLLILILRLIFDAPYIALGGDEPIKWIMATELSFYDFSGYENKTEQLHIHHQLRWGSWIFAFLTQKIFGLNIYNYYMSSYLPTILGIALFSYLIFKNINNIYLIIFFLLIFFDFLIYQRGTQLLPTSPGIFGLSLFIFFSTIYLKEYNKKQSNIILICLFIICFFLYGVKITNIVFFIILSFLIIKKEKTIKKIFFLFVFFTFFYFFETLFFQSLDYFPDLKYGRIHALINVKDVFLTGWYETYYYKFFFKGIFLRLYEDIRPEFIVVYFSCLIISFHYLTNYKLNENKLLDNLLFVSCFTFLVFILFNIFFWSSINPPTPAQIYENRYFIIINPLAYLIIVLSLSRYFKSINIYQIILLTIFSLIFFSNQINSFWVHFKNNDQKTIFERVEKYKQIKELYLNADCIVSKSHPLVKWLPLILIENDEERYFFQKFRFNKIIYLNDGKTLKRIINKKCDKIVNIDKYYYK
jgi:hypothetical protein